MMIRKLIHISYVSLLLLLTLQAYHAGAQEDMTGTTNGLEETAGCTLENALAAQETLSWTIYADDYADDETIALADAARTIIHAYDLVASRIYTPISTGQHWVLGMILSTDMPSSGDTDRYVFANDTAAFVLEADAAQAIVFSHINQLIDTNQAAPFIDLAGQALVTYRDEDNGIDWTLPEDWQLTDNDDMWLVYAPVDSPNTQIAFALLRYSNDCQRMNTGRARRDITAQIDNYTGLWHQQRMIGDTVWSIDTYRTQKDGQRLDGRLYLYYLGDTMLAINAQTESGSSASTIFRQLTSHIALIMAR